MSGGDVGYFDSVVGDADGCGGGVVDESSLLEAFPICG